MSELPGTASVGIEAVEWFDAGTGNLTVRVTGRWRRRRPASTGQITLVIEADGRRHRFPAMPEPPSLDGTGPGMWRLSFSVPDWMSPGLGGRTWLSLGTVTVPLPAPGRAAAEAATPALAPAESPGPDPPPPEAENRGAPVEANGSSEPGEPTASTIETEGDERRPERAPTAAADLGSQIEELERALADAGATRDQLAAALAQGDRARRIAEQRAHAEQALRRDLGRQLAAGARESERVREALGDLAASEERVRLLEGELRAARRRSDEAEQLAAAATVARARAERAVLEGGSRQRPVGPGSPRTPGLMQDAESSRLRFEQTLSARRAGERVRVPAEPMLRPAAIAAAVAPVAGEASPPPAVPPVPGGPDPAAALVDTLRRELDARAAGEAGLRSRLVAAETRLASRALLDERTTSTLGELRGELDGLRSALEDERARREAAEFRADELGRALEDVERELSARRERSSDAVTAITELRGIVDQLRPILAREALADDDPTGPAGPDRRDPVAPAPLGEAPGAVGLVEPARLTDALTRLRESVAPPEASEQASAHPALLPVGAGRPTLNGAFRRLVRTDAEAAGQLLLEVLPLQRLVYPHPIAYDLVLGPGRGCVRVTVGEDAPRVELHGAARTRDEIDFRVTGEPARIARLLIAHGLWRRLGPRVARVRGRREGLAALQALLGLPLDVGRLQAAGATLAPATVLALVAAMVTPGWTAGERFVVGYRPLPAAAAETTYLIVRDGRRIEVTGTAPPGRVATTIAGPPRALAAVLTGDPAGAAAGTGEATVSGDEGPLATLRAWIARAQNA